MFFQVVFGIFLPPGSRKYLSGTQQSAKNYSIIEFLIPLQGFFSTLLKEVRALKHKFLTFNTLN